MTNLSKKFDSLTAFSAWISNTQTSGFFAENNIDVSMSTSRENAKFTGTPNFETANKLMLEGWHEGAERVNAAMVQSVSADSDRPRNYNSVVGFAPNVARFVQGHPLNMINKKRVRVPARVVDIVYNCAVACNVSASEIETAAAKLFNVVAGLERAGMRVNLWVINVNISNNQNASVAVKIKTASQPFNLLKMIYPVVHPSFQRRHCFAFLERAGVTGSSSDWSGYGRVIRNDAKVKQVVADFRISDKNIFDYYNLSDKTEKQIADMIK